MSSAFSKYPFFSLLSLDRTRSGYEFQLGKFHYILVVHLRSIIGSYGKGIDTIQKWKKKWKKSEKEKREQGKNKYKFYSKVIGEQVMGKWQAGLRRIYRPWDTTSNAGSFPRESFFELRHSGNSAGVLPGFAIHWFLALPRADQQPVLAVERHPAQIHQQVFVPARRDNSL